MTLRDYVGIVKRWWFAIVIVLSACVILGSVQLVISRKEYIATAQIFVSTSGRAANVADLDAGNSFVESRVQSYTSVANSPAVTEGVIKRLGPSLSSSVLASEISSDAPLNKVIINLHVKDRSRTQAARLANAVASQFGIVVENLERDPVTHVTPVKLTVIEPASPPSVPASPKPKLILTLAISAGLIGGLLLAFILESLTSPVFATDRRVPADTQVTASKTDASLPTSSIQPVHRKRGRSSIRL